MNFVYTNLLKYDIIFYMDGLIIANIKKELQNTLIDKRINKAFQPKKDELVLYINSHRLLLSANATAPGIYLTNEKRENPEKAPMFCMLIRKHALGKIVSINQPRFERIIEIEIEARDELYEISRKKLIIEIMGKHSNIILVNAEGKIIDCIKHINPSTSIRPLMPGVKYESPPSFGKINLNEFDEDEFTDPMQYSGISPDIAKNYKTKEEFERLVYLVKNNNFKPYITQKGVFNVPTFYPEEERVYFETASEAVEAFYNKREIHNRLNQKTRDLQKAVKQFIARSVRKEEKFLEILKETEKREELKLYGELITANIFKIKEGDENIVVTNYYTGEEIEIILEANKTPSENAQDYFKQYSKQKRQHSSILIQQKENKEMLDYLEGILTILQSPLNEAEIQEVREELEELGLVKKKASKRVNSTSSNLKFEKDGFTILVGKNNKQNDELTKNASNNDIWFHAREIPGSHVIIKTENKIALDGVIQYAASLAALHSKAKNSSLVAVDYCLKKYVKKPNGAKPGMVIYTDFKTAFVKPYKEE